MFKVVKSLRQWASEPQTFPQLLLSLHLPSSQVFLDQCIHHPLLYFPAFYVVKDLVTNNNPDPVKAVGQFIKNSREDMIALWKVRQGVKCNRRPSS